MQNSWEELDNVLEKNLTESFLNLNLLKAKLNVLLLKKQIKFGDSLEEIQSLLYSKFNINPPLEIIEDELIIIKYDLENPIELDEDYFNGF